MPRVAAAELPGRGGTRAERLALAEAAIARASAEGAALVVLPEATLPGYHHARADEGPAARAFLAESARRHAITIAMGYVDGDACVLGLHSPDGAAHRYQKRFLSPAEARVWRPGPGPVIASTPLGRVGLAVCADVLQLATWAPFRGAVDLVVVAAAWPDYQGRLTTIVRPARPAFGWLFAGSNPYRDDLLGRAARAVGAPVVFANATGPADGQESFSGGSCVYDADGVRVAEGSLAVADVSRGTPGAPLRHPPRWAAFTRVYRWASAMRSSTNAPT